MIFEMLGSIFMVIGSIFMFIAALGIVRMPDVFLRMSSSTKAASLGVGFMLLAAVVFFNDFGITIRALATIIFILLTAPVSAHMIGRAAYFIGVRLWDGTITDEFRGRYQMYSETPVEPSPEKIE